MLRHIDRTMMKNRTWLVVLIVACVGLGIALIAVKKQATDLEHRDAERIDYYSNKLVKTEGDLDEQRNVTTMLEKDVEHQKKIYTDLTNQFTQVAGKLEQTGLTLVQTETDLRLAREETAKRDAKIAELESQNQVLDKQAIDLSTSLTNLTIQIADTQKKLAASQGDNTFLQGELKRLMAEKAELERQFNDLAVLRAQVSKLKEELSIARRIEWIRQGLFASGEQKGAQKLLQGFNAPVSPSRTPKPSYDLNVEVNSDGSVKVIPPLTNGSPASLPAK
jgi:septal ring factor EnvC (AmiA/AmiB activator)